MAIGSGWQAVVAYVNLATYYIIGLPIGCVLGFKTSLGVAVSNTPSVLLLVFLHNKYSIKAITISGHMVGNDNRRTTTNCNFDYFDCSDELECRGTTYLHNMQSESQFFFHLS